MKAISNVWERVSLKELTPGNVEELGETIEFFLKDYTRSIPIDVLSLLKCVLNMFNGDSAEVVIVESGGE